MNRTNHAYIVGFSGAALVSLIASDSDVVVTVSLSLAGLFFAESSFYVITGVTEAFFLTELFYLYSSSNFSLVTFSPFGKLSLASSVPSIYLLAELTFMFGWARLSKSESPIIVLSAVLN